MLLRALPGFPAHTATCIRSPVPPPPLPLLDAALSVAARHDAAVKQDLERKEITCINNCVEKFKVAYMAVSTQTAPRACCNHSGENGGAFVRGVCLNGSGGLGVRFAEDRPDFPGRVQADERRHARESCSQGRRRQGINKRTSKDPGTQRPLLRAHWALLPNDACPLPR